MEIAEKTDWQVPDPEDMERLLLQIALQDTDALAALYAVARDAVYAMALSCLKNADDAQDVTQDVFVRVWSAAAQYRLQGSPMAWLLAITRNLARMKLRQRKRMGSLSDEQWNAIPSAADPSPEDRMTLQTALAGLEPEERQIIMLHAASGLKHREIAALLGLPLATVLSKYHRALKKMRVRLEGADIQ